MAGMGQSGKFRLKIVEARGLKGVDRSGTSRCHSVLACVPRLPPLLVA